MVPIRWMRLHAGTVVLLVEAEQVVAVGGGQAQSIDVLEPLTDEERRTLEACSRTSVITIPGASFFTPNEEPALVAKLLVEAIRVNDSDEAGRKPELGGAGMASGESGRPRR